MYKSNGVIIPSKIASFAWNSLDKQGDSRIINGTSGSGQIDVVVIRPEGETAENVNTIIGAADNASTLAGIPHWLKTGEEAGGALKILGKITGFAVMEDNFYKFLEERKTHPLQATLHLGEVIGQFGVMVYGGEAVELIWNIGSTVADTGMDYYNHSHGKE